MALELYLRKYSPSYIHVQTQITKRYA